MILIRIIITSNFNTYQELKKKRKYIYNHI